MISKYIFVESKELCIQKEIFLLHNFSFIHLKYFFYYMNFSFYTFLVTISGLPFLFAKVRLLISVYELNSSMMFYESCQEGYRILNIVQ